METMTRMSDLPERYIPIGPPEKGGFGGVLKCRDNYLSRNVAIKFIQDELEKKRLEDELHSLLQVRSKHVVQVYDIIKLPNNSIGIVEEYVEGSDLWDSEYPRLSKENYLKILWQIASGIADIHNANIIHRDIKPSNMKLDNNEKIIKIFDFGLSRFSGNNNQTKGFKGSTGFAAPELYKDNTVSFEKATDTYAFGATAIYLASHTLPQELMQQPPKPLTENIFSKLTIPIPITVSELLFRCLSEKSHERPRMSSIKDEIARYLLFNKHQALIIVDEKTLKLNKENTEVKLTYGTIGQINIRYEGTKFKVSLAQGEVFINNQPAKQGATIPGSCVIAIGNPSNRRNNERKFITFDVSHPEVVI